MEPEYLSPPATAAVVRTALAAAFPGRRFSVRSQRYAGGASLEVTYPPGVDRAEVEACCDAFLRSDFDGTDDSTTYRPPTVLGDGRRVRFGVDFISCASTDPAGPPPPSPRSGRNAAIRATLAAAFPGTTFSVRDGRARAPAVSWSDGPSRFTVTEVLAAAAAVAAAATRSKGGTPTLWRQAPLLSRTVTASLIAAVVVNRARRNSPGGHPVGDVDAHLMDERDLRAGETLAVLVASSAPMVLANALEQLGLDALDALDPSSAPPR